ncbi:MAG: hypothetical protein J5556_04445, partial [Deltaproteobacteria bacterium]|nr:hypothetical protein [Deltaproteobacteria bacterium]
GLPSASLLTLTNSDEQAEHLMRAGCTAVLPKPVSRVELRRLVLRLAPLPRPRRSPAEMPQADSAPSLPPMEESVFSREETPLPSAAEAPDAGQTPAISESDADSAPESTPEAAASPALPEMQSPQEAAGAPGETPKDGSASKGLLSSITGLFKPKTPQSPDQIPSIAEALHSTTGEPQPMPKAAPQGTLEKAEKLPDIRLQSTESQAADAALVQEHQPGAAGAGQAAEPSSPVQKKGGTGAPLPEENDEADSDISPLLQRLAEQKEALQSASRANDVPAIRAAASDMAQTADELKLPSLADIAKCIAMEEETPDAGLIESAIETAQQALN